MKNSGNFGILISCEILGFVLVFLKIFKVIEISWILATSPFWVPVILLVVKLISIWNMKRKIK